MAHPAMHFDRQVARTETDTGATRTAQIDRVSAAFALSAAVTVVFSTLLAWAKDAYEPLTKLMAGLSGHHWTTHGIADVLLFLLLGLVFVNTGTAQRIPAGRLVGMLVSAVIAAALGLLGWFAVV